MEVSIAALRSATDIDTSFWVEESHHCHRPQQTANFVSHIGRRCCQCIPDRSGYSPLRSFGWRQGVSQCYPIGPNPSMCAAGRERIQRHHTIRDLVYEWCRREGLRPNPLMLLSTCLHLRGLLLPLTSPSRRYSGRSPSPWLASRQVRLQRRTLATKSSIFRRLKRTKPKGSNSSTGG